MNRPPSTEPTRRGAKPRPLLDAAARVMAEDPDCREVTDAVRTLTLLAFAGALSRVPELAESLCLKGGTLLRILHGGGIGRPPSMDLDASVLATTFDPGLIETRAAAELRRLLGEHFGDELTVRIDALPVSPHRRPQDTVNHVFRLHAQAAITRAMPAKRSLIEPSDFCFEATEQELIDPSLLFTLNQTLHGFSIAMPAYAPLQSIAEKLRALLQKLRHYDDGLAKGRAKDDPGLRGNFVPRHVLDLEILLPLVPPGDLDLLPDLFHRKCEAKGIQPHERTRERLLHPLLRQCLHDTSPTRASSAWRTLEGLVGLVLRDTAKFGAPAGLF